MYLLVSCAKGLRPAASCTIALLAWGALQLLYAAENDHRAAATILWLAAHSYDAVKLEVANNDGGLLVGTGLDEALGAVKLAGFRNDGGDQLIRLIGGTEGFSYRVSLQLWDDDRPRAPAVEYAFDVEGVGDGASSQPQLLALRASEGTLNVQVLDHDAVLSGEAERLLAGGEPPPRTDRTGAESQPSGVADPLAACAVTVLGCNTLRLFDVAEPAPRMAATILRLAAHAHDVVKLEIENNDGNLLVSTGFDEALGAVKLAEFRNGGGDLLIRLIGGTEGSRYRVSLQLWDDDRPQAPAVEYDFEVEGVGEGGSSQPQVLALRPSEGTLDVQALEYDAVLTSPGRSLFAGVPSGGAPYFPTSDGILFEALQKPVMAGEPVVTMRYRPGRPAVVDMAYWDTGESSLRMSYADRAGLRAPGSSPRDPYRQVALDLEAPLPSGSFYVRTAQGATAALQRTQLDSDAQAWRRLQYGFSERAGRLQYGADYSFVGSDYEDFLSPNPVRDGETSMLWARWPLGDRVSFKASTSERLNARGSGATHVVDQLSGLSTSLVLSRWPFLGTSIWYREGDRNAAQAPAGYLEDVRSSGASLSFRNDWGDHGVSTTYGDTFDRMRPGRVGESVSHYVYASVHPADAISLGAAFSVNEDLMRSPGYLWSGRYTSESLWATFSPPETNFSLSWSGYADGYAALDASTDYDGLYGSVTLAFEDFLLFDTQVPLAFTLQYGDYIDHVYPAANSDATTFWLHFGARPVSPGF